MARDRGGVFDIQTLSSTSEMQLLGQSYKVAQMSEFHVTAIRLLVHRVATAKIYHVLAHSSTHRRQRTATNVLRIQYVA